MSAKFIYDTKFQVSEIVHPMECLYTLTKGVWLFSTLNGRYEVHFLNHENKIHARVSTPNGDVLFDSEWAKDLTIEADFVPKYVRLELCKLMKFYEFHPQVKHDINQILGITNS